MKSVRMGDVKHIVVAHQDRLARFGFDFPHGICIMVRL
jgi:predicted site-specific integrase-resolvase